MMLADMLYFAYGSNLLPTQMQRRCPGAQMVVGAVLPDWQLILTTSGTANIVRRRGGSVFGGLWKFQPHHAKIMDQWEGVGRGGLRRTWVRVTGLDGAERSALTYVGHKAYPGAGRPNYVLGNMLPGAAAFFLPSDYHDEIRSWLPASHIGAGRRYNGRRRR
jgi:gamma-glutamylcyclotransferase (GGCT)/AIG2-like uncharacterized protein YtfP